jgi:hypothetical protein
VAQRILHSRALAPQISLHNGTGWLPGESSPARNEPILANAACESGSAVIGNDHTTVTASKGQHRQQPLIQVHVVEVRLESQQITGTSFGALPRSIRR